jgi:hypothetical protein
MVTDDDVRIEAEMLQTERGAINRFRTSYAIIQFPCRDVGFLDVESGVGIRDFPDTRDLIHVRFADEHHLVPPGSNKVPHDMEELCGKILVNEQELQSGALRLVASLLTAEHPAAVRSAGTASEATRQS